MSEKKTEADILEETFGPIIPEGFIGEQYADDIALVFRPEKRLISKQTKYQKVVIVKTETWGQILFIDNLLMKSEKDGHIINEMIVHPVMFTGNKKKKVLVIGGGEGFTASMLLKYPYIEKIDVIDIDNEFVEICRKYFTKQTSAFDNPRVNLIITDGLEYLKQTTEIYDAIFITPTDPLGLSNPLFIDEFYHLCKEHLTNEGILQTDAYMPFYKYGDVDYAYILKAFKKYFTIAKAYTATIPTFPGGLFSFVLGSNKYDPINDQKEPDFPLSALYYNKDIHQASFA